MHNIQDLNRAYGISVVDNKIHIEPTAFTEMLLTDKDYITINYQVDDTSDLNEDFVSAVEVTIQADNIDDPIITPEQTSYTINEGETLSFDALDTVTAVDSSAERAVSLADCFVLTEQGINFDAVTVTDNQVTVDSSKLGDVATDEVLSASLYYSVTDNAGGQAYASYVFEVMGV